MTASVRKRRHRTMLAGAVVAGSLVTIPVLGTNAWHLLRTSTEGRCAVSTLKLTYIPATPSAILALTDASQQVTAIELLAMKPANKDGNYAGGTVVIVPATAAVVQPDGTSGPIGGLFTAGGAEALKNGVDGLLGITSSMIAVEDAATLGTQLATVGNVPVALASPVTQRGTNGTDTQLFAAGDVTLAPSQVGTVLTAAGSADTEISRVARSRTVWLALAARIAGGVTTTATKPTASTVPASAAPTTAAQSCGVAQSKDIPGPGDFPTFFADFLRSSVNIYQLAALQQPVSPTVPAGTVAVDVTEVAWLMARLVPASVSPSKDGPTVFVQSAFSDLVTQTAVARFLYSGANVVLVNVPSGAAPPSSTLSVSDSRYLAAGQILAGTLGPYTTIPATIAIDGINVILTLGQDFNAQVTANATANAAATTTSTTVAPTTVVDTTVAPATVAATTTAAPATTKAKKKP